ncbi:MAG: hypothetical protein ACR2KJ_08880 [Jatrophihabitans sp.]
MQRQQASSTGPDRGWIYSPAASERMMVWVAIGMVNASPRLNAADALAVLQSWAYAHNQLIDDVARALVVDRALDVEELSA